MVIQAFNVFIFVQLIFIEVFIFLTKVQGLCCNCQNVEMSKCPNNHPPVCQKSCHGRLASPGSQVLGSCIYNATAWLPRSLLRFSVRWRIS